MSNFLNRMQTLYSTLSKSYVKELSMTKSNMHIVKGLVQKYMDTIASAKQKTKAKAPELLEEIIVNNLLD